MLLMTLLANYLGWHDAEWRAVGGRRAQQPFGAAPAGQPRGRLPLPLPPGRRHRGHLHVQPRHRVLPPRQVGN
jgi:hypothetical protein